MHASTENTAKTILLGSDTEISHFWVSGNRSDENRSTDMMLLGRLRGLPAHALSTRGALELGRRFDDRNGACYYSELGHLEACTPLCAGPRELVAYTEANRRRIREAQHACNSSFSDGSHITAMFESRCGRGRNSVSIGTHVNYLVDRRTWTKICSGQFPAVAGFVASAVAGIQLIAGQGCVGSANRRPPVDYQISQRSDFITRVACVDTMGQMGRGLINTRDEPECGPQDPRRKPHARFHHICLDFPINEYALYATTGIMSVLLAAVSEDFVAPQLILADPVNTFWQWSHDPKMATRALLADGTGITSSDYLARIIEFLSRAAGRAELVRYVPETFEIIDAAAASSDALTRKDWCFLSRRIDWVNKYRILAHAIAANSSLDWSSSQIAMLDQLYGSVDPTDSLYLAQRDNGEIDRLIDDAIAARALAGPPETTRSWGHTMLLRRIKADPDFEPLYLNWDEITVRHKRGAVYTVRFSDPRVMTRADCASAFTHESTEDVLCALASTEPVPNRSLYTVCAADRGNHSSNAPERSEV